MMLALSDTLPPSVIIVFAGLLGLILGSFVTALSYRLPRGISVAKGRSVCPACATTLTVRDLVPVVSWLMHHGACRVCGTKVSWRYPAIEITTAALFMVAAFMMESALRLGLALAATPLMVAIAVVDLEHRRIPNLLVAILAGFAIAFRYIEDGDFFVGLLAAFLVFVLAVALDHVGRRLMGQGLGMGDAKLMAIVAAALPPVSMLMTFCGAGFLGVIFGLAWRRGSPDLRPFPFAPALMAAFWVGLVAL